MRTKNKGKVHPSPSQPPPLSSSKGDDCLSVLKLLPAVILVLVSALSPEDKQVLAYLIARSLKTTTNAGGRRSSCDSKNKKPKAPVFDCECFDCYMSYWLRWDSSPNRELIHQIIEAFEDLLENNNSSAASHKPNGTKKKKKDKSSRRRQRGVEEPPVASEIAEPVVVAPPCDEVKPPEKSTEMLRSATEHKGLARKVLPDVMGLFNSRFWRLLNPNA